MTQGTHQPTPHNDYQADDGLWYPSNELTSYFKESYSSFEEYARAEMAKGFKAIADELAKELYGNK